LPSLPLQITPTFTVTRDTQFKQLLLGCRMQIFRLRPDLFSTPDLGQVRTSSAKLAVMSSSSAYHKSQPRSRDINFSNGRNPTSPSTCSSDEQCQFCGFVDSSRCDSASVAPSQPQSPSICPWCSCKRTSCKAAQPTSERRKSPQPSVCVDPECAKNGSEYCTESVCEQPSDYEENCEDCIRDCAADCNVCLNGDEPNCRDYFSVDLCDELFGGHATQPFDQESSLSTLTSETIPFHFGDSNAYSGTAEGPARPEQHSLENCFGSYDGPKLSSSNAIQFLWQPRSTKVSEAIHLPGSKVLAPVPAFNDEWDTSFHIVASADGMKGDILSVPASSRPPSDNCIVARKPPGPAQCDLSRLELPAADFKKAMAAGHPRNSGQSLDIFWETKSPIGPTPTTAQCQWADLDGQPCGKTFSLGSGMNEHLKATHGVTRENYCRWVGCRFGMLGATPHKYANSVERHTWGHSGYRPYKCQICLEGFAAAQVRDEHFANFHLKRKMFACDICNHQCTSARNLKRHKEDMHKTERFQCEFCNQNDKIKLFPRASNLARHFRKCKYVLAQFPDVTGAATGRIVDTWFPPGYRGGHQGMAKAKIMPPIYLPMSRAV
jgi:hypothetical protein